MVGNNSNSSGAGGVGYIMVGWWVELVSWTVLSIVNPFSLCKLLFLVALRTVAFAVLVWLHLLRSLLIFHVALCWRLFLCLTAPIRIFTALHRQRTLEMCLHDMQVQLKSLLWENKELEERLETAIKERKVVEMILEEVEEDHEKALSRLDLLEAELQDLKVVNRRLSEVHGKTLWSYKPHEEKDSNVHGRIPNYGVSSCSSSYSCRGREPTLQDADPRSSGDKRDPHDGDIAEAAGSYRLSSHLGSESGTADEALERRRVVALYRSLFSSILSILVGMIIWEAEDPCKPLVAALFTVVGMSLISVVQFFFTIKNKPASDAVALLSINWFILGAITSPSLPSLAHGLVQRAVGLADRVVGWTGFSSYYTG